MLVLNCIIEGEESNRAFCVHISDLFQVYSLKCSIKTKHSDHPFFKNILPEDFRLWSVFIKDTLPGGYVMRVSDFQDEQKRQLLSTELLSDVYPSQPRKGYIHIMIEKVTP
ncbi:hypothetical protein BGX28_000141, partial [Mortierella sp. GBA30]